MAFTLLLFCNCVCLGLVKSNPLYLVKMTFQKWNLIMPNVERCNIKEDNEVKDGRKIEIEILRELRPMPLPSVDVYMK